MGNPITPLIHQPIDDLLRHRIRAQVRIYPESLIRQRITEYRELDLSWSTRDTRILQACIRILEGELRRRNLPLNPPVDNVIDHIMKEIGT